MIKLNKLIGIVCFTLIFSLWPNNMMGETRGRDGVSLDYTLLENGKIKINSITNRSNSKIVIEIDGREDVTIDSPGSVRSDKIASRAVRFYLFPMNKNSSSTTLWIYNPQAVPKAVEEAPVPRRADAEPKEMRKEPVREQRTEPSLQENRPVTAEMGGGSYPLALERLNQDPFFGSQATAEFIQKADALSKGLTQSQDKSQFLIDNDVRQFLNEAESELQSKKGEIPATAQEAIVAAKITDPSSQATILNSVVELLTNRYNQREAAFEKLQSAVDGIPDESTGHHSLTETVINYVIIGLIVALIVVLIFFVVSKAKKKKNRQPVHQSQGQSASKQPTEGNPDNSNIVVRRKTTSILKKQSLDDVVNNPEYLVINTSDFTPNSAVRNIYVKNSCIKEVYNMYAEDLRDTNNPKEDGCMVLGRWVYDPNSQTYDISMETVVFPGDDAVFKEYELNFGGKIKLRVAEKLRKLRRETGLQYDLVCWIHSHPGLGVFFSNSDDNVQMQLKHAQHPNFLIAFVVDILTSDQELGIFTFRKDGSMNSKGDLLKMHSLEEMYKWALESDKASYNPGNYFNLLSSAKMQIPGCKGIELNNSSIIDLTQIVISPDTGIVGWAVGTTIEKRGGKEYVISRIVRADEKPSAGIVGALLNVAHMSLPTIQRMIANKGGEISFVLVHSSRQNNVTSIPVINGELLTDENFYGEETIDDLKSWTRRKR